MTDPLAALASSLAGERPRRVTGDAARAEVTATLHGIVTKLAAARGTEERDARAELMRRLLEDGAEVTGRWIEAELRC